MKKGKIGKAIIVSIASVAGIFGGMKLYTANKKKKNEYLQLETKEAADKNVKEAQRLMISEFNKNEPQDCINQRKGFVFYLIAFCLSAYFAEESQYDPF